MPFANPEPSEFVFLGGTTTGLDWRKQLIPLLHVNYFDPVVENWTEACAAQENQAKADAKVSLFVISPDATGLYSVAELMEQAMLRPNDTVVHFLKQGNAQWSDSQMASNVQIEALVAKHGAMVAQSLEQAALHINERILPQARAREWAAV